MARQVKTQQLHVTVSMNKTACGLRTSGTRDSIAFTHHGMLYWSRQDAWVNRCCPTCLAWAALKGDE